MRFDGSWREDKMSEADYMKAHAEADAAYAKAIQALIDEIKKAVRRGRVPVRPIQPAAPEVAPRMTPRITTALITAAIVLGGTLLYARALGYVPPYLIHDEAQGALQAHAVATTGHDLSGRLLPMYFTEPEFPPGRDPALIYVTALGLKVPAVHRSWRAHTDRVRRRAQSRADVLRGARALSEHAGWGFLRRRCWR